MVFPYKAATEKGKNVTKTVFQGLSDAIQYMMISTARAILIQTVAFEKNHSVTYQMIRISSHQFIGMTLYS